MDFMYILKSVKTRCCFNDLLNTNVQFLSYDIIQIKKII